MRGAESVPAWLRAAVRDRVAIDTRALAAFRIALGAILLVDLARRATDLTAFYTDQGVLPRATLAFVHPGYQYVSIHTVSGAAGVQWLLFAVAAIAAIALLLGYRTRLAVLVSLVLLVSIQARNPAVLNSGDTLLRRLLFWSLLLPLGERWAADARENWRPNVAGAATAGLLLQVVAVYVSNASVKLRADVWLRGDAVRYAFQLDHFTILLGDVLADAGPLLTVADWAWLALLLCSPLLVLLRGLPRAALAVAFAGFHAGMLVSLALGIFPLVSLAALVPFLPPTVWERLERRVPADRARLLARLPRRNSATAPFPGAPGAIRTVASLALVALILVNAIGMGVVAAPAGTPDQLQDRSWDMFAPSPPRATWWYAAPATLDSGQQVDALTRDAYDPSRPADAAATYRNERWRKFLDDAAVEPRLRRSLVDHLCWRWNRAHADEMRSVRLVKFVEPTVFDGPEEVQRQDLGTYRC